MADEATTHISVNAIGPEGAGKTSVLKALRHLLGEHGITATLDEANEWLEVELPPGSAAALLRVEP